MSGLIGNIYDFSKAPNTYYYLPVIILFPINFGSYSGQEVLFLLLSLMFSQGLILMRRCNSLLHTPDPAYVVVLCDRLFQTPPRGGGALGYFAVGMCQPGFQIGTPF